MSFRTLCDRQINLVPVCFTNDAGERIRDEHGNPVPIIGTPQGPIRAHRHRVRTNEELDSRDRLDDTYLYLFEGRTLAGDLICPSGLWRINDLTTGLEFEIDGDPIRAARPRTGLHHWEARARLITG